MEKDISLNLEKEIRGELKYLFYFHPNENLRSLILEQEHIILPSSGLHSTLCVFNMGVENEDELIYDVSQIDFTPFEIETLNFDDFDGDSLVLKLSRSEELFKLHKDILNVARIYSNERFHMIARQYFEDKYNPHLTISKSSSDFDRTSRSLIGKRDIVTGYSLARKVDGVYEKIHEFHSRR
jgi:2'-5' RNA ligase